MSHYCSVLRLFCLINKNTFCIHKKLLFLLFTYCRVYILCQHSDTDLTSKKSLKSILSTENFFVVYTEFNNH